MKLPKFFRNDESESQMNTEPKESNDKEFVEYVVRRCYGLRTQAEVDRKLAELRSTMARDEASRRQREAQEKAEVENAAKKRAEELALALKHRKHLKAYCRTSGIYVEVPSSMQDIDSNLSFTCPECGKTVDVTKQAITLAQRYEEKGNLIAEAVAMPAANRQFRESSLIEASILKVNHSSVMANNHFCSQVIELIIEGCREVEVKE